MKLALSEDGWGSNTRTVDRIGFPPPWGARHEWTAGQRQRPKAVTQVTRRRGTRPTLAEVAPLFHTYDAVKPPGAYFDEKAADRAVKWIEGNLRHFKGRWAGQPFYLMAWQCRLVRALFGWRRSDGSRLFRSAYVEAPRKSGKSTLASAIALYLAYGDDEAAPEVAFAAYDRDQAGICYQAARHMVEQVPELHAATAIYNCRKEMQFRDNPGGWLRALSRESASQFGLNLHGLIFDELMTQKTAEMWDALTTSQASREQPLIFAISTAGWDQESVCFRQRELARQVAEGTVEAPWFLGVVTGRRWTPTGPTRRCGAPRTRRSGRPRRSTSTVSSALEPRRCRPNRTLPDAAAVTVGRAGRAVHRHAALGSLLGRFPTSATLRSAGLTCAPRRT